MESRQLWHGAIATMDSAFGVVSSASYPTCSCIQPVNFATVAARASEATLAMRGDSVGR